LRNGRSCERKRKSSCCMELTLLLVDGNETRTGQRFLYFYLAFSGRRVSRASCEKEASRGVSFRETARAKWLPERTRDARRPRENQKTSEDEDQEWAIPVSLACSPLLARFRDKTRREIHLCLPFPGDRAYSGSAILLCPSILMKDRESDRLADSFDS